MGNCQNLGSGYPKYSVPYYVKDPKRDHDFDNHPESYLRAKVYTL